MVEEPKIYCDADWASQASRKSMSGYIITLAGGAIAWSSKRQTTIALSTAEAEYVAVTHVAKEALWLHALFTELGIKAPSEPTILSDNQAAIAITHHPEFHARTKHIDMALHFVRDLVKVGKLKICYVRSEDNIADIFTKGLPRPQHVKLKKGMGLTDGRGGVLESDERQPKKTTAAGAAGDAQCIGDGTGRDGEAEGDGGRGGDDEEV